MNSDSWCSPRVVAELLHAFWPGGPDIDPASNSHSIIGAKESWSAGSLHRRWYSKKRRRIWLNPPFSRLDLWVRYHILEYLRAKELDWKPEAVLLVPVATSAAWWKWLCQSDAAMFTKRLTFIGDKPFPARFDTVLSYLGPRPDEFRLAFKSLERWYLDGESLREHLTKDDYEAMGSPLIQARKGVRAERLLAEAVRGLAVGAGFALTARGLERVPPQPSTRASRKDFDYLKEMKAAPGKG